jgi:hypothetical protein
LTTLELGINQIDHQGAQALAEVLKSNITLTRLNLRFNPIKKSIVDTINQKLKINTINKKRLKCLQILCLKKLKLLNRIDEIKFFNPIIYESCLMKY